MKTKKIKIQSNEKIEWAGGPIESSYKLCDGKILIVGMRDIYTFDPDVGAIDDMICRIFGSMSKPSRRIKTFQTIKQLGFMDPCENGKYNERVLTMGKEARFFIRDSDLAAFYGRIDDFYGDSLFLTSQLLSGERVVAMGMNGETRISFSYNPKFSDHIRGFNGDINTSQLLPGDSELVLAMGEGGETRIFDPRRKVYGEDIEGFHGSINTSQLLPNGNVLVMGNAEVRIFYAWRNGYSEKIEGFNGSIMVSALLPDGNILAVGYRGARIFFPASLSFSEPIAGFPMIPLMQTIQVLANGDILIGGQELRKIKMAY